MQCVKAQDLQMVLFRYAKDAEEAPEPADSVVLQKEIAATKPPIHPRRGPMPKTPKTPALETGDDGDDEEEDEEVPSSEPLAGGKYQYLTHVRPVKVNLNPAASAVRKPLVARPALRGRKRARNAEEKENSIPDPCTARKPNLVHLDPDPRLPDDTGFLSDLDPGTLATRKKKRTKRLSRLQVQRVRIPHWQRDPVPTPLEAPTSARIQEEIEAEKEKPDGGEETDASLELASLPEIPESVTVAERRQMEELKLRMEKRVWRIRVLRMREREGKGSEVVGRGEIDGKMEEEADEQVYEEVDADGDVVMSGRVLRRRKGR